MPSRLARYDPEEWIERVIAGMPDPPKPGWQRRALGTTPANVIALGAPDTWRMAVRSNARLLSYLTHIARLRGTSREEMVHDILAAYVQAVLGVDAKTMPREHRAIRDVKRDEKGRWIPNVRRPHRSR